MAAKSCLINTDTLGSRQPQQWRAWREQLRHAGAARYRPPGARVGTDKPADMPSVPAKQGAEG